jgi:MFS transporter, DHA2 family, methylenomycin A resistance protein
MTAVLLSTIPRSLSGLASGLLNAIRQAGAAIGVALYEALMRGNVVEGLRNAVVISTALFAIAGASAAVGIRARDRAPNDRLAAGEVEAS